MKCDGCGERATATRYWADGPWAGRTICRECASGHRKMTRLSRLVAFKFRLAQVLPPDEKMTAPILRLMMAVDDVRRAQIKLIEAGERLDGAGSDKHVAVGDWLYFMRLLFSHVHEALRALGNLDTVAPQRADQLLAGRREALRSLKILRKLFSSADYKQSLIARVRNVIGFHYDDAAITALVKTEVKDADLLESTAASVGGLARMADPLVRGMLNILNGGDFMVDENHTQQVKEALNITGDLITVVDHLFDALMQAHLDAVVERHETLVDVPPLVIRAGAAVEAAKASSEVDHEGSG